MLPKKLILTPALLLAVCAQLAQADVPLYGQCGGSGYTGETTCVSGAVCQYSNEWYSQCVAGTTTTSKTTTKSSTSTTKSSSTTSKTSSTSKTSTTSTKTTTTSGSSGTGSANGLEGYATLNGGTTGGAGGATVTVSDVTALRAAVSGTAAKIIRISTIIQGDGDPVDIGSNPSILGSCGGFRLKKSSNVIIRNLKL